MARPKRLPEGQRRTPRASGKMARHQRFMGVTLLMSEIDFLKAYWKRYGETGRWNAKLAALDCGHPPASAAGQASAILGRPHVRMAYEAMLQQRDLLADVDVTDAMVRHKRDLDAIAHSNILDTGELRVDEEGNTRYIMRPSEEWPIHAARAVKKIKQKETIKRIEIEGKPPIEERTIELELELHDKVAGLKLEAQEQGLLRGLNKVTLPDGSEIESQGGVHVYQVMRFNLPDNGRGPKPVAALEASGAPG